MQIVGFVLLGLLAGALSGLTGMGGGIIVVPALIYLFGYSIHLAEGTTLALLVPPIGILAAWNYYQKGYVNITVAVYIALGFVVGSVFGSRLAVVLSDTTVRRIFAVVLGVIAANMFFQSPNQGMR